MSDFLKDLTSAQWHVGQVGNSFVVLDNCISTDSEGRIATCWKKADAEFIALARNAFDVMMRRGWWAQPCEWQGKLTWIVCSEEDDATQEIRGFGIPNVLARFGMYCATPPSDFPDPFTALVEADAWYKANVEATPK